jgi:hypothetical protein
MKKFVVPLILFIIPYCLGLLIKNQLWATPPNLLSEQNLNFCLQQISFNLPIGLMLAGVLVIAPRLLFEWTGFLFIKAGSKPTAMDFFQVRVAAGVIFFLSFYSVFINETMRNACFNAVALAR